MGEQKNIVTVNGKTYDLKTGVLTHDSNSQKIITPVSNKTLEGFIRQTAPQKPQSAAAPLSKREVHGAHEVHGRRQKSKTLARSGVKKPKIPKPQSVTARLEPEPIEVIPSIKNDSAAKRANHAKNVPKSHLITKFHESTREPKIKKRTEEINVKPVPAEHVVHHESSVISESLTAPEPTDFFSTALSHASTYQQIKPKKLRRNQKVASRLGVSTKAVNIGASALLIVVLAGFITYQNMSSISMHMASARAGINATLPGYKPAGFAFNKQYKTSPGQVVLSYHSNSDDRNFNITQKVSDWNSQTLLDNFVATTDQSYQRINQPNGKTVYIYGDSNATWVDGGIWYKVDGDSNLSTNQLLSLANSF